MLQRVSILVERYIYSAWWLTNYGHPEDLAHRPRDRGYHTDNETDHAEDDGARSMLCDSIHGDSESKHMARHQEDDEEKLSNLEHFPS